ncbi:MAG: DUF885 domain-containing protein [Bryobacterales bacterium]|nr:DUF885 domain-containing protein [Bryobacterales bacterium]
MALSHGVAATLLFLALSACTSGPPPKFSDVVQEYVFTALSFEPVTATGAGYHVHNGIHLNEILDDFDSNALAKRREFYLGFRKRLGQFDAAALSAEDRADYDIIHDHISLQLAELDTIQSYKHNPTVYVELIGNALFTPFVLEYGTPAERYRQITARLAKVPALLGQARQNLVDAPEIWTQVAVRENDGNHDLIVNTLTPNCPKSELASYDRAAREALKSIDDFTNWLNNDLAKRKADWRLGAEKYSLKFAPVLSLGLDPKQVLADAEAELAKTRAEMIATARPLHAKLFPGAKDPGDASKLISTVLGKIALKHGKAETYFDDAKRDLEQVRAFIREKGFVGLPGQDNLKIIETPVFMRGIYAVGGFNPAPALMPELGAFYWLTPIPTTLEPERIESRLREYNTYGLKILTIHEGLPGHYLQFEYANRVQPNGRRVLRAVYGNGPYVEGWAVYATKLMIEHGYLDNDPELLLTWHKQYLRAVANTILDVRLHTQNMTDEQAMDLMINQTFQEKEEATAKLQRAKLSSTQLPTYFTGYRAWLRLREQVKEKRGGSFNLAQFHEQALKAGAVSMPALERIMMAPPASADGKK